MHTHYNTYFGSNTKTFDAEWERQTEENREAKQNGEKAKRKGRENNFMGGKF